MFRARNFTINYVYVYEHLERVICTYLILNTYVRYQFTRQMLQSYSSLTDSGILKIFLENVTSVGIKGQQGRTEVALATKATINSVNWC